MSHRRRPSSPSSHRPLRRSSVRSEICRLRSAHRSCEDEWSAEVEAYECRIEDEHSDDDNVANNAEAEASGASSIENGIRGAPQDRPATASPSAGKGRRHEKQQKPTPATPQEYRNRPNASGTVTHPHMFPYHDALYPLLDLYYHLETEDWTPPSAAASTGANDASKAEGELVDDEDNDDDGGSAEWETESEEEESRADPDGAAAASRRRSSVPSDAPTEHTSHLTAIRRSAEDDDDLVVGATMPSLLSSTSSSGTGTAIVPPSPVFDTYRRGTAAPPPAGEGGDGADDGDDGDDDGEGADADGAENADNNVDGDGDGGNDDDDGFNDPPPQAQVIQGPREADVPGYMPNSAYAVYASLLPRHRARSSVWERLDPNTGRAVDRSDGLYSGAELERAGFEFLERWEDELWTEAYARAAAAGGGRDGVDESKGGSAAAGSADWRTDSTAKGASSDDDDGADLLEDACPLDRHGPVRLFPADLPMRADVLLRVIRHASSDLQRDHRLGRAALLLLCEMRCFEDDTGSCRGNDNDDRQCGTDNDEDKDGGEDGSGEGGDGGIARLRRLLSILSAEYVRGCDWGCHARFLDQLTDAELLDAQFPAGGGDIDDDDDEENRTVGRPNHHCQDWRAFVHCLSTVLAHGISHITSSHATTLAAYALMEFDAASGAAAAMDERWFEGKAKADDDEDEDDLGGGGGSGSSAPSRRADRQKTMLKQNIFYFNHSSGYGQQPPAAGVADDTGGDPERPDREPFRIGMVNAVVTGLGWHAVLDRARLRGLLRRVKERRHKIDTDYVDGYDPDDDVDDDEHLRLVRAAASSHRNCVRALVDIAENVVRRLPPNGLTMALGGRLVRYLLLASTDGGMAPNEIPHEGYVGNRVRGFEAGGVGVGAADGDGDGEGDEQRGGALALISPTRYADAVAHASTRSRGGGNSETAPAANGESSSSNDEASAIADAILSSPPPDDVRDCVRSLFVRDLVDVNVSGCGYGDFLVWTGLPLGPYDPMLFDHVSQYPDRTEEQESGNWGLNEEGYAISGDQLASRYDFSLLMLVDAWNKPWTPHSHASFSSEQRKAMGALALCAHRYGVPADIATLVNGYLPRGWWNDERRRRCWCHDCQLRDVSDMIRDKVATREVSSDGSELAAHLAYAKVARGSSAAPPPTMHNLALTRLSAASDATKAVSGDNSKGTSLQTCPGCHLAAYCSSKHKKYLWQDGHGRVCGTPPFRVPGVDEQLLIRDVFGTSPLNGDEAGYGDGVEAKNDDEEMDEGDGGDDDDDDGDDDDGGDDDGGGDDDDSGDWESIDTDEGSEPDPVESLTRTELIHRFFESKSYRLQDRQAAGAAAATAGFGAHIGAAGN